MVLSTPDGHPWTASPRNLAQKTCRRRLLPQEFQKPLSIEDGDIAVKPCVRGGSHAPAGTLHVILEHGAIPLHGLPRRYDKWLVS